MAGCNDTSGVPWLKAANSDLPFAGGNPLDRVLRGSIDDLYAVRRYLDAVPLRMEPRRPAGRYGGVATGNRGAERSHCG
jgi:hypothetical protein